MRSFVLLLVLLGLCAPAFAQNPVRLLFGCEPDKLAGTTLNINPGSVADFYGGRVHNFPGQTSIDLTRIGPWGHDRLLVDGQDLCVYCIEKIATGEQAFMGSPARYATDVVYPAGYTFVRKLPWGAKYRSSFGGVPDFHLTGWPMPYIRLTGAQYGAPWAVLPGVAAAGAWRSLDLSGFLPDNARLAEIVVEVRYNSGAAGSGYVRSPGGSNPTGVFCGSGSPGSIGNTLSLPIRTDSDRHIEWYTTGDVVMWITVIGYWMTEPS